MLPFTELSFNPQSLPSQTHQNEDLLPPVSAGSSLLALLHNDVGHIGQNLNNKVEVNKVPEER